MSPMHDADNRRRLEPEQIIDAKQALGCGAAVSDVARFFGLQNEDFRQQVGLPVWRDETANVPPWNSVADGEVSR